MRQEAQPIAAVTTSARRTDLSVEDVVTAHPVGVAAEGVSSVTIVMIDRAMEGRSKTPSSMHVSPS